MSNIFIILSGLYFLAMGIIWSSKDFSNLLIKMFQISMFVMTCYLLVRS